jgi:hypothetical protein
MSKSNIQKNRERTEEILHSLDKHQFMTRSQIQKLHNLGSDHNARRVLRNMDDFLNFRHMQEKVYYLNKVGRERVGSTKVIHWIPQVEHILMRNDLFLYFRPIEWRIEEPVSVGEFKIIPDVIGCKKMLDRRRYFFVEIDNAQRWTNNLTKLKHYKRLKEYGTFQEQFGYFPNLVWLTKSSVRAAELRKYKDLTMEIYEWEEIK